MSQNLSRGSDTLADPFETSDQISINHWRWQINHMFAMQPAMGYIQKKLATFKEFPPVQAPEGWTLGDVMQQIINMAGKH